MTGREASADEDAAFLRDIVARACAGGAEEAQATLSHNARVEVDFETRRVNMLRTTEDDDISLTAFRAGRKGTAATTLRTPDAVARAVADAIATAEATPADAANGIASSEPGPPTMHGPAQADRDRLIGGALDHIDQMSREYPEIVTRNAYYQFDCTRRSFANSAGLARQETRGRYSFFTLFAARRGGRVTSFNYHGTASYAPFPRLASVGALPQLYRDQLRSFDARPAPGKFVGDVIIAPDALYEMVIAPVARVLGGYCLMAGTSPFAGKIGQAIASPAFSLLNRPTATRFPGGVDFDAYGLPTGDIDIISGSVLRDFLVDFYVSRKLGLPCTAVAQAFVVPPGRRSVDEMIASTARGVILTRYSGGTPGDNLDFSGIAKNAFYIEGGEVRYPLAETMISGNLRDLILAIREVSRVSVTFADGEYPAVAASGVTIHGRA